MMEVPQILLVGKRGTSNVNKVQVGFGGRSTIGTPWGPKLTRDKTIS